jgi:hypothetical protein
MSQIITSGGYELEYLFRAETYNGNIIKQNPLDTPKFSLGGSSFTDVLKEHIKRFSLVGKGHIFTIDLQDGHFEADGNKLYPPNGIQEGANLKLIYWRTITRDMMVGPDGKMVPPKVRYTIGWQYNKAGHNYDWQIGIE